MRIYHGTIITLDTTGNVYKYLVEDKGKILFTGDHLPEEYAGTDPSNIVDLGERSLLPAFGDGHMHFSSWALIAVSYFDVRQAESIRDVQDIVRMQAQRLKHKKALLAFGISKHSVKEQRLITRAELDDVCPDRPLVIVCYDGHSAVFNSKMLEKFPKPVRALRGFYEDKGHLFNEAYLAGTDYATKLIPPQDLVRSIIKSYDLLAANGVGLIHATEGIGFPKDLDVSMVSFIAKAVAQKTKFQTRMFFQTMDVEKAVKRKLPRIGGCFATALDGCFGACDAALHEPYSNDPDNSGILFQTEGQVVDFAKAANRKELQIELHAIGDAAVARAVRAFGAALSDHPRDDHRHTIIHACLMKDEDMRKIADLNIGITLQPSFLISPLEPLSYLEKVLGDRILKGSPLKSLIREGIHVSGGSDAPVTHPDPIEGIYACCNHPYDPAESVSIMDALKMYTIEVARTTFDDHNRGSLETGKTADMVILNTNPLAMDPTNLRSLKVDSLLLGGEPYRSGLGIGGMLWNGFSGKSQKI
jgi:predicted amidohydrolase YtcJ